MLVLAEQGRRDAAANQLAIVAVPPDAESKMPAEAVTAAAAVAVRTLTQPCTRKNVQLAATDAAAEPDAVAPAKTAIPQHPTYCKFMRKLRPLQVLLQLLEPVFHIFRMLLFVLLLFSSPAELADVVSITVCTAVL